MLLYEFVHFLQTFADPAHYRNSHRIADCLVSRSVWTVFGRFAAIRDFCPVIGEALQTFTLFRRESANNKAVM